MDISNSGSDRILYLHHFFNQKGDAAEVKWISVEDELPENNQTVLIYFPYSALIETCHIGVARFVKGLANKERLDRNDSRSKTWMFGDEGGNNLVPYRWAAENGPCSWFGQEVTYWKPLPKLPKSERKCGE